MSYLSVSGKDISRLVTKFQYDGEDMCFEISLRIKENRQLVLFLKTNDYGVFRKTFDELMSIRAENHMVDIPQSSSDGLPYSENGRA